MATETIQDATDTDDEVPVYDDLESLLRVEGPRLGESAGKLRVYRVIVGKVIRYAVSNSPGQAALAVCDVDLMPAKVLAQAAYRVIGERRV